MTGLNYSLVTGKREHIALEPRVPSGEADYSDTHKCPFISVQEHSTKQSQLISSHSEDFQNIIPKAFSIVLF